MDHGSSSSSSLYRSLSLALALAFTFLSTHILLIQLSLDLWTLQVVNVTLFHLPLFLNLLPLIHRLLINLETNKYAHNTNLPAEFIKKLLRSYYASSVSIKRVSQ